MEMLFLFLILNSNSMINESGFMPDFLFSVNRYYDIIETNLTQIWDKLSLITWYNNIRKTPYKYDKQYKQKAMYKTLI